MPDLMTIPEAPDYLRCSTKTVDRLLAAGAFKAFQLRKGSPRRVRKQDVDAYVEQCLERGGGEGVRAA